MGTVVSKPCAVCPRAIVRRFPSELRRVRTCGRRCGGQLQREEKAARRLQRLTDKRLHTMTPLEAFRWGYKCGYQRRVDFEKQQTPARAGGIAPARAGEHRAWHQ